MDLATSSDVAEARSSIIRWIVGLSGAEVLAVLGAAAYFLFGR